MDTQTQIQRLIELAIVQRSELKQLVAELPQLREHLNAEIERVFEETEPQLRVELEEFVAKQAQDRSDAISFEVQEKIKALAQTLQDSAQAKFSALMAERERNVELTKQAEAKIAEAASALPSQVKEIVAAELARFPRAGEIDQLRKEFAEPKGLNPRGKWSASETYNRLDLVSYNGDSYVSNTDGNREKPSRTSSAWTLNAARGMGGGGGGVTSLTDLVPVPANGELLIGNGSAFVNNTLTAGTGVTITNGPGTITIDASGAQEILTATVKNADSVTITKGQVVYLFGATGNMASVKLAYNTSDATSAKTFGVVASTSIAPNGTGTITCVGVLDGLMLGSFNDGDTVYLGATPGSLTATKPYAPNHLVYVGVVERANNGNGELYVKVQNGYELDEIHDVQITTPPAAGSLLMRDATNSLWKANRLTAGTNIAITNADTAVTVGLTGTVAVANGGTGVTSSTGTGSVVLSNSPTLVTPVLGTPQSGTLSSCTGLPISTGVSGLGSNVATFLATPSSTNLRSAVTDETGTGSLVFANTPTLVTPVLGDATGTTVTLTGNATVADVRFGTSGPSAKSSIAARASRQGLVQDGTAANTVTVSAVGSTDFSIGGWVRQTSAAIAGLIAGNAGSVALYILANGTLRVDRLGTGSTTASTGTVTAGKDSFVMYVRSGTTGTYYIDGVAAGTTSDSFNYSTTIGFIGGDTASTNVLNGKFAPYAYNRALTAAEVVSLYESGVPAGSDYGSSGTPASNTSIVTGDNSTFASNTGYWTLANGATISGGKCNLTGGANANVARSGLCPGGKRFRISFTVSVADAGLYITDYSVTTLVNGISGTGVKTYEFTGTSYGGLQIVSPNGTAVIDDLTLYPIGLLLAPDAGQAGGGLTWYDTSGNSANITLPASGVSWNVPSSQKTATGWTFGGDVSASGSGAFGATSGTVDSFVYLDRSTTGRTSQLQFRTAGSADWQVYTTGASTPLNFYGNGSDRLSLRPNGNLLLGTTTDSGNGKLQLASHTTSAGGIGFGTAVSLFSSSSGVLNTVAGVAWPTFKISDDGTGTYQGGALAFGDGNSTARNVGIWRGASNSIASAGNVLNLGGYAGITFTTGAAQIGSQTTALTLDSSQNATFAGTVAVQNTAAKIYAGTGSPEGVVTASPGSLYLNVSGGNNTTLYVKQSGTGNTGWNAK